MAIAYLPSLGNIERVNIREDDVWYGESIGDRIIETLRVDTEENRGNYYRTKYGNLNGASTWFYKDATDYNFINGLTLYRCIYIGADSRFTDKEIIGALEASVTHDGPSSVDDTLTVEILPESRIFTAASSIDSTVLYDEQDSTGILDGRTGWGTSFNITDTLNPGQYIKVWIKLSYEQDPDLQSIVGYNYYVTLKDLRIPIARINGRLNLSRVFTLDLLEDTLTLRASLPQDFDITSIIKTIEHNGLTNIFYKDSGKLYQLVIKRDRNVEDNKYIKIDLSAIAPNLTQDDTFYSNFSECCGVSPTTGSPATTGTTGSSATPPTSADPCVYKPLSDDYDDLVDTQFLVDIFASNKELNNFYIFFNTFLSDTTAEFITKYGHKNYYWNSGVIYLDLNYINDVFFENVDAGLSNTKIINLNQQYESIFLDTFYTKSIVLQDDLFTGIGFIPEDCRVTNNKNQIWYLWEGDIVNRTEEAQTFYIPSVRSNVLSTVPNMVNNENNLLYDATIADTVYFGWTRDTAKLNNGVDYVQMGPPHQNRFHHGYSEVSYDISSEVLDEFSTTWAFGVESSSIVVSETPPSTASCATTGTTGTTGTSGTSGTPCTSAAPTLNPNQQHVVYQKDVGTQGVAPTLNYVDEFIEMFRLHCNGNIAEAALNVSYNWCQGIWNVGVNDKDGEEVIIELTDGPPLGTTFENVITLNIYRQQDYGCYKRFITQYSIHVNGIELLNGITYTDRTTDTYVVTHNHNNDFSGWVSYWEVRNYLKYEEAINYADAMYKIFSNISWGELETEEENQDSVDTEFKKFNFRRNILLKNLDWDQQESLVFPIVLQGTGYNIGTQYNEEVRRSVFDFRRIDVNNKSFAFTLEGSSKELMWVADTFDVDMDMLTIWVRLDNWNGQRLTMYYSDSTVVQPIVEDNKPYELNYYAVWHMDQVQEIVRKRYIDQNIFEGGESIVLVQKPDETQALVQIDRQYQFGVDDFYASNKFDVRWDDRYTDKENTESINAFFDENLRDFKPNYMEIRDVGSKFNYTTESENNNENRGADSAATGSVIVSDPGAINCR